LRKVQDVLPKAVEQAEALRGARAQNALRAWETIVGPVLAQKSWPDRYGNGTVWVAVEGSAWAQELRMMRETILDRLRERSGEPALFKAVRFGVRPLPERPLVVEETEPEPAASPDEEYRHLSIREIARRRLEKLRESGT